MKGVEKLKSKKQSQYSRVEKAKYSRVENSKSAISFKKILVAISTVIAFLTGIAEFIRTVIQIIKELN